MIRDIDILNKLLANRIQKYVEMTIYYLKLYTGMFISY